MNTITSIANIKPLPEYQKSARQSRQIRPGQSIQAKVLGNLPGNMLELDLAGTRLAARTNASLKAGQNIELQVLKTMPQVEMKIIGGGQNWLVGKAVNLIGKDLDISSLFKQISANDFNFSKLSTSSSQALTNFFSLQNTAAGDDINKLINFIDRFSAALQSSAADKSGQTALPFPSNIQNLFSELTTIFKNFQGLNPKNMLPIENLPQDKAEIVMALVKLVQNTGSGKEAQAAADQLAGLLGIGTAPMASAQIQTAANKLQDGLFALLHLLKGGGSQSLDHFTNTASLDRHLPLAQKEGGLLLQKMIDNLGLKFEALLAKGDAKAAAGTLKAALIEIGQQYQHTNITETSARLLATLELFQQAQMQLDRQLILPLPLPFLEQGYLLIDKNAGGNQGSIDKPKEVNFSLHLNMKELGNIRVDFHTNKEGLYLKFNCESASKADFVAEFQDELKAAITASQVLGLSFGSDADDPASELIKKLTPAGESILNTTA